jgi:hypothetical protein
LPCRAAWPSSSCWLSRRSDRNVHSRRNSHSLCLLPRPYRASLSAADPEVRAARLISAVHHQHWSPGEAVDASGNCREANGNLPLALRVQPRRHEARRPSAFVGDTLAVDPVRNSTFSSVGPVVDSGAEARTAGIPKQVCGSEFPIGLLRRRAPDHEMAIVATAVARIKTSRLLMRTIPHSFQVT